VQTVEIAADVSSPVPRQQIIDTRYLKRTAAAGEVIIKRDSGVAGAACTIRASIDGLAMADLSPGEKIVLYLPEGDHIFSAKRNGLCGVGTMMTETKGTVEAGKILLLRIGAKSSRLYGYDIFITSVEF
jgi:hypothetical protein